MSGAPCRNGWRCGSGGAAAVRRRRRRRRRLAALLAQPHDTRKLTDGLAAHRLCDWSLHPGGFVAASRSSRDLAAGGALSTRFPAETVLEDSTPMQWAAQVKRLRGE